VFYSETYADNDYGTKIKIKCHQRIQRKARTLKGESCMNWELIDSFGVRLDYLGNLYNEIFYDDPREWNMSDEEEKVLYNVNIYKKVSFDRL